MSDVNLPAWEARCASFLETQLRSAGAAHDAAHVRRVVATAKRLAEAEAAALQVVVPAAWLHDCVTMAKDSPRRAAASAAAAQAAVAFLEEGGYPRRHLPAIAHAIEAHSFSAAIEPRTPEARVVQDADRLDALGAIGIARCLMVGGALARPLYDVAEPFPERREADDSAYVLDHFYTKLLELPKTMRTTAGRTEARLRARFMEGYLERLRVEIAMAGEGV